MLRAAAWLIACRDGGMSSVLFYRTGELQKSGRCEASARPKLTFKK
jgi:hypothetical protein